VLSRGPNRRLLRRYGSQICPNRGDSSLILRSHFCFPGLRRLSHPCDLWPYEEPLTPICANPAFQQLNRDSEIAIVLVYGYHSDCGLSTAAPPRAKSRSVRNWGAHQVRRGKCGASKCSLFLWSWVSQRWRLERIRHGTTGQPLLRLVFRDAVASGGLWWPSDCARSSSLGQIGTTCR